MYCRYFYPFKKKNKKTKKIKKNNKKIAKNGRQMNLMFVKKKQKG
jgi:hypothetical protein